jgi:hypothetical protein
MGAPVHGDGFCFLGDRKVMDSDRLSLGLWQTDWQLVDGSYDFLQASDDSKDRSGMRNTSA